MTLPNSSYEELLDQVRKLTHETMLLQEHLSANCNPDDYNHNLSLVQKNYEKGIELADTVIRQCEHNQQQDGGANSSQASSTSDLSNIQRPWSRLSEGSNIQKIPPGDLQSRLIAWRDKNRHLLPLDKGGGVEKRRPVSLHGPREEILFGSVIGGCTWKPASHLLSRAHSAEPTTRQNQEHRAQSMIHDGQLHPFKALDNCLNRGDEQRASDFSIPESYAKNKPSYEFERGNADDDNCPNSPLLQQKMPKTCEAWPINPDSWSSGQPTRSFSKQNGPVMHKDPVSSMNFTMEPGTSPASGMQGQRKLGAKLDVVYSLLGMLGSSEGREDMSATLLSMSNSVESCEVMRQSGCLPLLIQLIHAPGQDPATRERASRALYNIIHAKNDDKFSRREARVLRFLEQLRDYCQALRLSLETRQPLNDMEKHPSATIAALMKLSFDESHRQAMCQLGGLHSVAELVEMDHAAHGNDSNDSNCITLRRYSGMALTNLTFGDGNNKALLCSFHEFMKALVFQLRSPSDDLRQVTASVLRNLSWRADSNSKQTLREVGTVIALMKAAMEGRKESTLKSILSALWNLSAHCSTNKMDICAVEGALAFLVDMLSFNAPSKTLSIVENAGGILRNVSSHIAVRDDYRAIVRERGCLQVLLRQLRSPSLTVVSNACGTLWNLSARCPQDQLMLWDLGAVPMLRSLVHSKHKMISMGSSAALKNLLSARPNGSNIVHLDSTARRLGLPSLPSLTARKQKALEQEIDQNLAETCDNIEPSISPVNKENKFTFKLDQNFLDASKNIGQCFQSKAHPSVAGQLGNSNLKLDFTRSESRESMRSVTSTQSDTIFEKVNRHSRSGTIPLDLQMKQQSTSMHSAVNFNPSSSADVKGNAEKKYTLSYMNAIPERLKPGEPLPNFRGIKCTDSTLSWAFMPNQDTEYHKGSLNSSTESKLSISNSSDLNPLNGTKVKSTSKNSSDIPLRDTCAINFPKKNLVNDQKGEGHSSDDDKQSSAYFTGTDQEQCSIKTWCAEGSLNLESLNSSRTSLTSDSYQRDKFKTHSNYLSDAVNKTLSDQSKNTTLDRTTDSLQYMTASESTSTLEPEMSLESDSDIFEGNIRLEKNSGAPSLSSFDGESEHKNDKNCSESNLMRYKTNNSLNDIEIEDTLIHQSQQKSEKLLDQQSLRDDEDFSEATYTTDENDFYTVQETYTIEDNDKLQNKLIQEDDCSVSQTLTYISVDDDTFSSRFTKNEINDSFVSATSAIRDYVDPFENKSQVYEKTSTSQPWKFSPELGNKISSCQHATDLSNSAVPNNEALKLLEMKQTGKEEYHRHRDPDAMIASLDRLTVTLVQESEAMREREMSAMKASLLSTDTWNEDSPNDVSFPSISGSVPMIPSFKSDLDDDAGSITELAEDLNNSFSMTDSKIIEREAIKLAEAVSAEVNQISLTASDIDAINPPSNMGSLISLTASMDVTAENADNSGKGRCESDSFSSMQFWQRKKSLPVGVVARRALNQGQNRTASLENLLNECNVSNLSQLENVKPPSIMDELLDGADMENSLLSVASINCEIADNKDSNSLSSSDTVFDLIKPVANVLSMACLRNAEMQNNGNNSLTECLENINPPSLFNEITQMDESNAAADSHCNDTLCIDEEFENDDGTHVVFDERIEEATNDTDEAITPISSEYCSSVESTPKKRFNKKCPGRLTPKQKRQLVKERYKTYTIAGELEKKEEEIWKKQQLDENSSKNLPSKTEPLLKLTPKQRRQEDRTRFQTQTLDTAILNKATDSFKLEDKMIKTQTAEKTISQIPMKTGIPMFRKFSNIKTVKDTKINTHESESYDKYRTMTLVKASPGEQNMEQKETASYAEEDIDHELLFIPKIHNEVTSTDHQKVNYNYGATESILPSDLTHGMSDRYSNNYSPEISQNLDVTERNHNFEEPNESRFESDDDSEKEEKYTSKIIGPRIVKPGALSRDSSTESNAAEKQDPEAPKGIRGRRKPLYSKTNVRNSTPQCSPLKQATPITPITRSNSSPLVRATRAQTLRQNNSLQKANAYSAGVAGSTTNTNNNNTTPEKRAAIKRSSIPQKSSSTVFNYATKKSATNTTIESPIKPLERQGTFTKDEPEMVNTLNLPSTPSKGVLMKPTTLAKSSPKPSTVNSKLKTPLKTPQRSGLIQPTNLTKTASAEKITTATGIPMMTKRSTTNLSSQVVKSSSNHQISSPTESGNPRKMSLGQRSNSNSSIVSTSSTQGSRNKMVKEATSKIASLWKKVEENKKHQKFEKPDCRHWIVPNRESSLIETSHSDKEQVYSLIKTSTFEGATKDTDNSNLHLISETKLTTV